VGERRGVLTAEDRHRDKMVSMLLYEGEIENGCCWAISPTPSYNNLWIQLLFSLISQQHLVVILFFSSFVAAIIYYFLENWLTLKWQTPMSVPY
jgi:hypothetical protein